MTLLPVAFNQAAPVPAQVLNKDGSLIAAPDIRLITQLDLAEVGAGLTNLDTEGRYARPDVLELKVDTNCKDGVAWQ